jgi:hypothetical protein
MHPEICEALRSFFTYCVRWWDVIGYWWCHRLPRGSLTVGSLMPHAVYKCAYPRFESVFAVRVGEYIKPSVESVVSLWSIHSL